jgi:hypothetical protein
MGEVAQTLKNLKEEKFLESTIWETTRDAPKFKMCLPRLNACTTRAN